MPIGIYTGIYSYNFINDKKTICYGKIESVDLPKRQDNTSSMNGYIKINMPINNITLQLESVSQHRFLLTSALISPIHNWTGKISGIKVVSTINNRPSEGAELVNDYNILVPNSTYPLTIRHIDNQTSFIKIDFGTFFCQSEK